MISIPPQSHPTHDERTADPQSGRLLRKEWYLPLRALAQNSNNPLIRYGTAAQRAALNPSDIQNGTIFVVTDWNGVQYQLQGGAWLYLAGTYERLQSELAVLADGLGAGDSGLLVEVTDYRHVLKWSGSAWAWGPGEDGRHDIVGLPIDPDDTTGWQLCDGTTVDYLKGDGSTGSFATPDLVSTAADAAYLKLADTVAGPTAATAPTLNNPTVDSNTTGVSTNTPSATTLVTAGAVAVASATHTHGIADPGHIHTLSGGSIDDNGEPRHYDLRPWFRR